MAFNEHLCDAVKFWVFWTLQAVWVWVTLLPVMILNGCANNPSKYPRASPSPHASPLSFVLIQDMSQVLTFIVLPVMILGCSATDPNQRHSLHHATARAFSGQSWLGLTLSHSTTISQI